MCIIYIEWMDVWIVGREERRKDEMEGGGSEGKREGT